MRNLRDQLWGQLAETFDEVKLNGPPLESEVRLDRNLNCRWKQSKANP